MNRRVVISAADFRAIMQWDDDGATQDGIDYVVVPDAELTGCGDDTSSPPSPRQRRLRPEEPPVVQSDKRFALGSERYV